MISMISIIRQGRADARARACVLQCGQCGPCGRPGPSAHAIPRCATHSVLPVIAASIIVPSPHGFPFPGRLLACRQAVAVLGTAADEELQGKLDAARAELAHKGRKGSLALQACGGRQRYCGEARRCF